MVWTIERDEIQRNSNESYNDYFVRLFERKDQYQLTCQDIADLLNCENGENFGESVYRKRWVAFNAGRIYERQKQSSGIVTRILTISDTHVPFQLPKEVFSNYIGKIDILQINGDVVDCFSLSKFDRVYRISPMDEIIQARQYLIELIEYLYPKKVVINFGNHDQRFERYLSKNLDSDVLELMPKTSLELICEDGFHHYDKRNHTKVWYEPLKNIFNDIEVQYIDNWFCQIGQTIFCHPLAFNGQPMKTAEKAMYFFRNEGYEFSSLVMAHTHRIGQYSIGNTDLFEQGCCCDTSKMNYSDGKLVNSQREGFLFLGQDKDGKIIKYKQERLN